jgi:hypothetical protein
MGTEHQKDRGKKNHKSLIFRMIELGNMLETHGTWQNPDTWLKDRYDRNPEPPCLMGKAWVQSSEK